MRERSYANFLATGRGLHDTILELLPDDWSFEGKRVLDFGCGAGRTLREFLAVAETAEIWGCDIHAESIEWLQANLCPPFHCFRNQATPPLAIADGYFDLVWAMSVFTHIADGWADWVLEMQRVLAPGGLFIATYLGAGIFETLLGEPYVEDEVGMLVRYHWRSPEDGGAWVFHSEWWLREHWGPAFEILEVRRPPTAGDGAPQTVHSVLLARRRPGQPSTGDLERVDQSDPRELAALQTSVRMLRRELEDMRRRVPSLDRSLGRPLRRAVRRLRLARRTARS